MSQLEKIANRLKRDAQERGRASQALNHGLVLTLFFSAGTWTLAMSRREKKPSDVERHTCEKAFGIPRGRAKWKRTYSKPWYRVWYRWSEFEQAAMSLDTKPLPDVNNYRYE